MRAATADEFLVLIDTDDRTGIDKALGAMIAKRVRRPVTRLELLGQLASAFPRLDGQVKGRRATGRSALSTGLARSVGRQVGLGASRQHGLDALDAGGSSSRRSSLSTSNPRPMMGVKQSMMRVPTFDTVSDVVETPREPAWSSRLVEPTWASGSPREAQMPHLKALKRTRRETRRPIGSRH